MKFPAHKLGASVRHNHVRNVIDQHSIALSELFFNAKCGTVDYALVWDQPHSEADYEGDVLEWIDKICREVHP